MGCATSNPYNDDPKVAELRPLFESLHIDERCVNKLYRIFKTCDISGDGTISDVEVMILIKMQQTPFLERVFRIFDTDNSGEVDFKEFTLAIYNYCTLSHEFLPYFAFSLYDLDNKGQITNHEVQTMLRDIWGTDFAKSRIAADILNNLTDPMRLHPLYNLNEFLVFVKTHDRFLFPVAQVVSRLQDVILGKRYWMKLTEARMNFSEGKYIKFEDLLDIRFPEKEVVVENPAIKIRRKSIQKSIGLPVKPKRISANIKRSQPNNSSPKGSSRTAERKIHLENYKP